MGVDAAGHEVVVWCDSHDHPGGHFPAVIDQRLSKNEVDRIWTMLLIASPLDRRVDRWALPTVRGEGKSR